MKIETRFEVGQKVFAVNGNENCLYAGYIDKITISICEGQYGSPVVKITYWFGKETYTEDKLFETEDEACLSLKNTIKWIQ